jgi:tRNA U34 5-carboxymethylaminomethyl modifying enzyme MnmG/GidA
MGRVIDRTGIQFRLLNRSRGPAVQSPRAQADRLLYRTEMRRVLESTSNLSLRQGKVVDLLVTTPRLLVLNSRMEEHLEQRRSSLLQALFSVDTYGSSNIREDGLVSH